MLIEISEREAREVCLVLRYFYDASTEKTKCHPEIQQIYINVAARLQDALKIEETPWNNTEPYEPYDVEG